MVNIMAADGMAIHDILLCCTSLIRSPHVKGYAY